MPSSPTLPYHVGLVIDLHCTSVAGTLTATGGDTVANFSVQPALSRRQIRPQIFCPRYVEPIYVISGARCSQFGSAHSLQQSVGECPVRPFSQPFALRLWAQLVSVLPRVYTTLFGDTLWPALPWVCFAQHRRQCQATVISCRHVVGCTRELQSTYCWIFTALRLASSCAKLLTYHSVWWHRLEPVSAMPSPDQWITTCQSSPQVSMIYCQDPPADN